MVIVKGTVVALVIRLTGEVSRLGAVTSVRRGVAYVESGPGPKTYRFDAVSGLGCRDFQGLSIRPATEDDRVEAAEAEERQVLRATISAAMNQVNTWSLPRLRAVVAALECGRSDATVRPDQSIRRRS